VPLPDSGLFATPATGPAEAAESMAAESMAADDDAGAAQAAQAEPFLPGTPQAAADAGESEAVEASTSTDVTQDSTDPAASDDSDTVSPFELAARAAAEEASQRYIPAESEVQLLGAPPSPAERAHTPIFDSISVWFADDRTASTPRASEPAQVIDLRDGTVSGHGIPVPATAEPEATPMEPYRAPGQPVGNRWASLGDQRWVATNLRAAAAPETAGNTSTGLPKRRPGANLLPSAAAAAGTPTAAPAGSARRTDAESVRGRLGSYQRGLSSARRARHLPPESDSRTVFNGGTEAGQRTGRQGGDT
jgi:hypothetical protein